MTLQNTKSGILKAFFFEVTSVICAETVTSGGGLR